MMKNLSEITFATQIVFAILVLIKIWLLKN